MTEYTQATEPDAEVKGLDRLVGTWEISGGTEGKVTYRWLEGGFFLVQEIDLMCEGVAVKGVELIGREREFGATEASEDIKSRVYDNNGNTLSYVYELVGDELTIWGGEKGSPAYFRGTFNADGTKCAGAWHFPGDGGYESTMTKIA